MKLFIVPTGDESEILSIIFGYISKSQPQVNLSLHKKWTAAVADVLN
ncbi:hypothetical protein ACQKE5_03065 [Paenisporosarcina sp. NPDC076898]